MTEGNLEKRSEVRYTVDSFYSVEFLIGDTGCLYQFKIWNISGKGMCILMKEDSLVLEHIKSGDSILMRYQKEDERYPTEYMETQIRHITKDTSGKFEGHVLIGLMLLKGEHTIPIPPDNHSGQSDSS